ncbi:MAG: helix-turn-helix domain-containing protein [bacterium]|nr:helix-turn-helix domain-containing protein [bacterium]
MMNKGVFLMTYAEAIKKLRSKMILTQMEFAQFLGVSFASINRWETGRFEPTMKIKRKLAPLFKEHGIEVE